MTLAPKVKTGLDALVDKEFRSLKSKRIALLANQAAVDCSFNHLADLLDQASGVTLTKIFAPEHGFRGVAQDMEGVRDTRDPYLGTPIVSLYGDSEESLIPQDKHFEDVDTLVVDLPDIGTRYYTYAQTLAYCMKRCVELDVEVVVLDRPNPINGETIEGGPLSEKCRSFCGYAATPQRHSLTLGELALLFNQGLDYSQNSTPAINCSLSIEKVTGWKRNQY